MKLSLRKSRRRSEIDWTKVGLQRLNSFPRGVLLVLEVAALLRVDPHFVIDLIEEGALLAFNISSSHSQRRHYRVVKESLIAYLQQKGVPQLS